MNPYVKEFLHRGLLFAGFGPVVLGIVYACISASGIPMALSAAEVLSGILSTYLLAFLQAGASVFHQIEHWPVAKSLACHFGLLYAAYVICYLVNTWIPFRPGVVAIFTAVFAGGYFVIWITVFLSVKAASRRLNNRLR